MIESPIHALGGSEDASTSTDQALARLVAVMDLGVVEQIGRPVDIFLTPRTRFVAEFIGFDSFIRGVVVGREAEFAIVQAKNWIPSLSCSRRAASLKIQEDKRW